MTMPRMSGEETFLKMHRQWPNVPVILMSGYSEVDTSPGFLDRGLAGFIQKPYDILTLKDTIRTVLSQAARGETSE